MHSFTGSSQPRIGSIDRASLAIIRSRNPSQVNLSTARIGRRAAPIEVCGQSPNSFFHCLCLPYSRTLSDSFLCINNVGTSLSTIQVQNIGSSPFDAPTPLSLSVSLRSLPPLDHVSFRLPLDMVPQFMRLLADLLRS